MGSVTSEKWKESVNSSCSLKRVKMIGWRITVLTLALVAAIDATVDERSKRHSWNYRTRTVPINSRYSYYTAQYSWPAQSSTPVVSNRLHPIQKQTFYSKPAPPSSFSYFGLNRPRPTAFRPFYGHSAFYHPLGPALTTTTPAPRPIEEDNDYTDEERADVVALLHEAFGQPDDY